MVRVDLEKSHLCYGKAFISFQVSLGIQLFHHLFSAVLIGGIFVQTGDDAKRPFANVKFCLSILVFFLYTHIMAPVLLCESSILCQIF